MTKPANLGAIEKATKKSWGDWLKFFDSIDAKNLSHKEIAQKVYDAGTPGWWSQTVTVAYEQYIGRRVPGQDGDGKFQVGASKTFDGTMDDAFAAWLDLVSDRKEFSDIPISRGPTTSETKKWRYWHCGLSDGSRISISIYQKAPSKASFGLGHEKIDSKDQAEHWREYWKDFIKGL